MNCVTARKKAPYVVLLAVALVLAFAGVAYASGYFTWTASFTSLIDTRTYSTPNSGNHTQYSYVNHTGSGKYTSSFWEEHWYGDNRRATQTFYAGSTHGQSYYNSPGSFHWTITKTYDGTISSANGTVYYP